MLCFLNLLTSFHGRCTSTDGSLFIFDRQVGQDAGPEFHEGQPHFVSHIVRIHFRMDVHVLVTCTGKFRPCNRNLGFATVRITSAGEGEKKGSVNNLFFGPKSNSCLSLFLCFCPVRNIPSSGEVGPVGYHVAGDIPVAGPVS